MTRNWITPLLACVVASAIVGLSACHSGHGGDVRFSALGARPLALELPVREGVYGALDSEHGFWFSSMSLEELAAAQDPASRANGVVVHAQLVWKAEPGLTPMSTTATNTVVRILVLSEGEVGLYGGAGFAREDGQLGSGSVELDIRGGTLTLLESTKGFHDLMSPAELTGRLTARLAVEEVHDWRRAASQFAANAFGKSMWVGASSPDAKSMLLSRR